MFATLTFFVFSAAPSRFMNPVHHP